MTANGTREKFLIGRYGPKIFAFTLHWVGGGRDKAYDVASSCFAEAAARGGLSGDPEKGLAEIVRAVLRVAPAGSVPIFEEKAFEDFPPADRRLMRIVHAALVSLPSGPKALILMRDQINLGYQAIASALASTETDVRNRTNQARLDLRRKIGEMLQRAA